MGAVYAKPPILEALCEFRFEPGPSWDGALPGLFYAEIREDFPKRRERRDVQLGVRTAEEPMTPQVQGTLVPRMQFLREDEQALIQMAPNLLAVNQLRPYPTWPDFRTMIERALAVYRKVAAPVGFRRIGVRYINRIEVPFPTGAESLEIEDYIRLVPQVPEALPQVFARWGQRTEIPYEDDNGVLALMSGSADDQSEPTEARFLLDFDFRTLDPRRVGLDDVMTWVDQAHDHVEAAFEASITERCRRLFGETHDDRTEKAHG